MRRYSVRYDKGKGIDWEWIFIGIDVHRLLWHVTIRMAEVELFHGSIPGRWEALRTVLDRYQGYQKRAVYEAGYFGFWLYDRLIEYGVDCVVTPPSLVPQEYGNHVKTDRRDSRKLAQLLAKGLLRRVWVPTSDQRYERQVIRRRKQLMGDRVRTQNRIKAELRFYGLEVAMSTGQWTKRFAAQLKELRFGNRWMEESFQRLVEEYQFLTQQIEKQTKMISALAQTAPYQERVKVLCSTPGIGLLSAMEYLLELQDVHRFRRGNHLAAYVGLTPSQYSSGEKVRMGRITAIGKNDLRGTLVEVAWRLIAKDPAMRNKYEDIKVRAGSKRAIIAIARILLLRTRRMLLDGQPYMVGLTA
jgi:transposase